MKALLTMLPLFLSLFLFGQDTEPNNDPTQANTLSLDQEVDGTLSLADVNDYYKLDLDQGGLLKISTTQTLPGGNYFTIFLIDAEDDTYPNIKSLEFTWGTGQGTLNQRLLKGSYLIRIGAAAGNVDYKFTASLTPPVWAEDVEHNNTAEEAIPIELEQNITGNIKYYEAGKGEDLQDWYALQIMEAGYLSLEIEQPQPGGNYFSVYLIDGEKEDHPVIKTKNFNWGAATGTLGQHIHPGNYFIRVGDAAGPIHYKFTASLAPTLWSFDTEPNGDTSLAKMFPNNDTLTGHLLYYSAGDGLDEIDWYEVDIPNEGQYILDIYKQDNGASFWCALKDPGAEDFPNLDGKWFEFGHTHHQIKERLQAGKYFVVTSAPTKGLSYKLINKYYPDPIAKFEYTQVSNTVVFNNQSSFGKSYKWDFGDDKESTAVNPLHKYDTPGVYDACLEVKNEKDVKRESCQEITVEGLASITPNSGGNTGFVTVIIAGGGFSEDCKVRLEQDGIPVIEQDTVFFLARDAISLKLDLWAQAVGVYDVVVETNTGKRYLLPDAFTIEEGERPDPWVSVNGRDKILFNTPSTYNIQFGNRGNVDAYLVPLWIAISNVDELDVYFSNAAFLDTLFNEEYPEDLKEYFETDTLFGEQENMRIYSFILPSIPASSTKELSLKVTTPEDIDIMAWVNDPYIQFRESEQLSSNESGIRKKQSDYNINVAICVAHLFSQVVENQNIELNDEDKICVFESYAAQSLELFSKANDNVINAVLEPNLLTAPLTALLPEKIPIEDHVKYTYSTLKYCLGGFASENKKFSWGLLLRVIRDQRKLKPKEVQSCYESNCRDKNKFREDEDCEDCSTFCQKNSSRKKLKAVSSFDPNEKTNMSGYAEANYIKYQATIPYTIYYENIDSATAPAHIVRIVDTLDKTKFDFSSFQFNSVTIGDSTIYYYPGQTKLLLDFLVPELDVLARFYGNFDSISGEVKWIIESLDPISFEPIEDPDKGFLPPNINKPEGEGNVSFYINLKSGLPNRAKVDNEALIYFDYNEPIITNLSSFSLDLEQPASKVEDLDAEIPDTLIPVYWTGSDQESGVRLYDVYVSENGEEFVRWKGRTSEEFAYYNGEIGNNYRFFSVAVDSVGNEEALPVDWDAETNLIVRTVNIPDNLQHLIISPNPVKDQMNVEFYLNEPSGLTLFVVDQIGNIQIEHKTGILPSGSNSIILDPGELSSGLYLLEIRSGNENSSTKFMLID